MDQLLIENQISEAEIISEEVSTAKPFIEANTIGSTLQEIRQSHLIPVFLKDNEPLISHADLIETTFEVVKDIYHFEDILSPNVRLSHPIKGRIPEAKNKPAKDLLEHEKTLYFERMAFIIEVPSIHADVAGNRLNLCIGGVKGYNLENLYSKSGVDQHFKLFVGFKNTVCCNLCVSTDGILLNLKVRTITQLRNAVLGMLEAFNAVEYGQQLQRFEQFSLSEQQFATLIGRCRMYRFLPDMSQQQIPELMFGETQINSLCRDYYQDKAFCRADDGSIDLWKVFNLFTNANKSSYIDTFLDRGLNAYQLTLELLMALQNKTDCWYLS